MDRLGRIRHLVAPNIAHWSFLKEWQQRCPDALTWAAPSLRQRSQARKAHLKIDRDLDDAAAREWSDEMVQAMVPGGANFQEVAFFHLPTRTLVLTDLVENLEPGKVSPWIRPLAKLLGVLAPDGMAPVYLRMIVKRKRREAAQAVARMVDWQPERSHFQSRRLVRARGHECAPALDALVVIDEKGQHADRVSDPGEMHTVTLASHHEAVCPPVDVSGPIPLLFLCGSSRSSCAPTHSYRIRVFCFL